MTLNEHRGIQFNESRLQELRARINDRLKHPYAGRFDASWDIEQSFYDDVQTAKIMADYLVATSFSDSDKYYFCALADEIKDTEIKVRNKWRAQDRAIEESKNSPRAPPKPVLPQNQTTL